MIPTLNDLENALINGIAECEPGRFFTSVAYDDEDGSELTCDVDGWIDDEDGGVTVYECAVLHYDAEGNDLPYDDPDVSRIEREASLRISGAMRDARDVQETEDMLCWGGWFV